MSVFSVNQSLNNPFYLLTKLNYKVVAIEWKVCAYGLNPGSFSSWFWDPKQIKYLSLELYKMVTIKLYDLHCLPDT